MRELIRGVGFCLMMATMLHSIAVGQSAAAWVKVACVDINPATVTKLDGPRQHPDGRRRDRRGAVPAALGD